MIKLTFVYKSDQDRKPCVKYFYINDYILFMKNMTKLILVQKHEELIHGEYTDIRWVNMR